MKKLLLRFFFFSLSLLLVLSQCTEQKVSMTFEIYKNEEKVVLFESLEVFFPKYTVNEDTHITINSNSYKPANLPAHVKILSPEFSLIHDTQIKQPVIVGYTFSPSLIKNEHDASRIYFAIFNGQEWKQESNSYIDINKHSILMEIKDIDRFICLYSEKTTTNTAETTQITNLESKSCLSESLAHMNIDDNMLQDTATVSLSLFTPLHKIQNLLHNYISNLSLFDIKKAEEKETIVTLINEKFNVYENKTENQFIKTYLTLTLKAKDTETEYLQKQFTEKLSQSNNKESLTILAENIEAWIELKKSEYYRRNLDVFFTSIDNTLPNLSFPIDVPFNGTRTFVPEQNDLLFSQTFSLCIPNNDAFPSGFSFYYSTGLTMTIEPAEKEVSTPIQKDQKATMEKILYKGNELKEFANSFLLSQSDFPKDMTETTQYFMKESPYPAHSPLTAARFIENGYIGSIVHAIENKNLDEKVKSHQPLVIVYNACFFQTSEGAAKVLDNIKMRVTKEQLAESFLLQQYNGINLNIKPLPTIYGNDSYSFLIDGRLNIDTMELDFKATIVLFRIGPVLTIFNSLSIGTFKLHDIEVVVNKLEHLIFKTLESQ